MISWRSQVIALAGLPSGPVCLGPSGEHGGSYCLGVPGRHGLAPGVAEHGECRGHCPERQSLSRKVGQETEGEQQKGAGQCLEVS